MVELFAPVREAADRTVGLRPYDVQMLAGVALGRGYLIEMQTGEGKTLAAVAPACLQALSGFMLSLGHRMFDGPWLNTQLGDHHERSLLAATSQKGGFAHSQPFAVHKVLKGLFMVGLERQSEA